MAEYYNWWERPARDNMHIVEEKPLAHAPGFIKLRERHVVKANQTKNNVNTCHCRIRKVKLK